MCKRDTEDPLVRLFLDKYSLHLLERPREDVEVGDVYPHYDGTTWPSGSLGALLSQPLPFPEVRRGEKVADMSGTLSSAVSTKLGLGLLDRFLSVLGAAGVVATLESSFEAKGARSMRLRFARPTRDWVDPIRLEVALRAHRVDADRSALDEDRRDFLVTAVLRGDALSIRAEDRGRRRSSSPSTHSRSRGPARA